MKTEKFIKKKNFIDKKNPTSHLSSLTSQKGITLASLAVYIIVIFVVLATLLTITAYFKSNLNSMDKDATKFAEFDKFNLYFLEEVKRTDNNVIYEENAELEGQNGSNYIEFSSGNKYEYDSSSKKIYLINGGKVVSLASNIGSCTFKTYKEEEKTIIKVSVKIASETKEVEYVLGYGNKYSNYENNEASYTKEEPIKIGDVVNYIPDSGSITIESGDNGSGYSSQQTFATQTGENALQWKVLDIDETTNQVTLVSATPTTATLTLQGANGWTHSVDILDDICETCYSKVGIGTGRSIDVEDINKISGYTPSTGTTYTAEYYASQNTNTFPNFYLNEILTGRKGESERSDTATLTNGITSYTNTNYQGTITNSSSDTVITDAWYGYYPENQANYRGTIGLIYTSSNYWLAFRCVSAYSYRVGFGVRYIEVGGMRSYYLFYSDDCEAYDSFSLRPLVTLDSNVNFSYDSVNRYWNII